MELSIIKTLEVVSTFENSAKDSRRKKRTDSNITVLLHDGLCVERYQCGYIVAAFGSVKNKKGIAMKQFDHTYNPELPDAMVEISKRLFHRKLAKREEAGQSDIESLIQLVRDHRDEMSKLFGI